MVIGEGFNEIVKEFKDIFVDELPKALPPRRPIEFEINTKIDHPPPVRPVIRLSEAELKELKRQLKELLSRVLIRPSS